MAVLRISSPPFWFAGKAGNEECAANLCFLSVMRQCELLDKYFGLPVSQAVEELFALMRLFAGVTSPDPPQEKSKEEEAFEASFRRDTIILYQNCLDGGASWTTLIRYGGLCRRNLGE